VAAQPSGKAVPDPPSYLHPAEVADILHVSPKTVSRWAKEGKLPFLKTLGGHRRYPTTGAVKLFTLGAARGRLPSKEVTWPSGRIRAAATRTQPAGRWR
jgi:excisionase family DNA binding protein